MKIHLSVFVITLSVLLFSVSATAQDDREDVMYLKSGTIYRGTIIEQIPNVSYKIEIAGGSVIVVAAADVVKITKEPKAAPQEEYYYKYKVVRTPKPVYEYHFRPRGYFFQAQVEMEALELGFRIVNGYKFGQFGYLGLGVGIDGVILDIHGTQNYAGAYFPVYIHYGGDILKKQITPFYSAEAGYAFHPTPGGGELSPANILGVGTSDNTAISSTGGLMAGVGFGARFYSRRRVHFDVSAHLDIKQSSTTFQAYDSYGFEYNYTSHTVLLIPGLRFGIGF